MTPELWRRALAATEGGPGALPRAVALRPLLPLLRARRRDGGLVVGQIGQSLDGRIATASGHSHYINGPAALDHLHRLRALCDAVLVGAGTVLHDNPALTVRRCEGRSPARVVVDPRGRLAAAAGLFTDGGPPTFRILAAGTDCPGLPGAADIRLPAGPTGAIEPAAILAALAARGLRRVLVEGGARTLSGFLERGALDRLHVLVAPLIIGAGPTGLHLPPIDRLDGACRPPAHTYRLGPDMLYDLDLGGWSGFRALECAP